VAITSRRRPYAPRLPPAERREQLLDSTLAIISEEGYEAVSMESIARRAGVTRPVVYGAFSNLALLLAALFRREENRALEQLSAIVPPEPDERDPDRIVVEGIAGFLARVAEHPQTWRLILFPVQGTPDIVRRQVERNRAKLLERIRTLVEWGLERRGGPSDLDPDLTARAILSLAEDSGRLVLTDPERFPPERVTAFSERILAAIERAEPRR
jgi:AcrR family transcriptional regulator